MAPLGEEYSSVSAILFALVFLFLIPVDQRQLRESPLIGLIRICNRIYNSLSQSKIQMPNLKESAQIETNSLHFEISYIMAISNNSVHIVV